MQKIRVKFEKKMDWLNGNSIVTVEMSYDVATGWRAQPHFGGPTHTPLASNLKFRILTAHGMDLTTILAMEHPQTFKSVQLECLHRMEQLEGAPEEIAREARRERSHAAGEYAHA